MKKIIFTFAIIIGSFQISQAQLKYGAGASLYLESPSSFGVQAKALYTINDQWSASGSFTYFLEDFTFWAVDFDAHYKATTLGKDMELHPFVGLGIRRIGFSFLGESIGNTDTNINLGASLRKPISQQVIYIEPKIILGEGSAFLISAGILF